MKKTLLPLCAVLLLSSCSLEDVFDHSKSGGKGGLGESDMIDGLKTALQNGIVNGSLKAQGDPVSLNGYLKDAALAIILPDTVQKVFSQLEQIDKATQGGSGLLLSAALGSDLRNLKSLKDSLYESINRAAAYAAPKSVDIFKSAIVDMSFTDAKSILFSNGDSVAATSYLKGKTYTQLGSTFQPIIQTSLEKVRAQQIWSQVTTSWNSLSKNYNGFTGNSLISGSKLKSELGLPSQLTTLNTDMSNYVTKKGLDGLFIVVGREEKSIRQDPVNYVTDLGKSILEKVFTYKE